jgi:hypothetical protein
LGSPFCVELRLFRWSFCGTSVEPEFNLYYVAYPKDDPAKEPVAASYSARGVLAEAAHKTGRAKADSELREISKEEYEALASRWPSR